MEKLDELSLLNTKRSLHVLTIIRSNAIFHSVIMVVQKFVHIKISDGPMAFSFIHWTTTPISFYVYVASICSIWRCFLHPLFQLPLSCQSFFSRDCWRIFSSIDTYHSSCYSWVFIPVSSSVSLLSLSFLSFHIIFTCLI